ncbi:MAG: hypothetical protein M1836_001176 [Candelina mexicana]|nr:MAG: hypothetical protein M1836_001176 [Candelina mexicana]
MASGPETNTFFDEIQSQIVCPTIPSQFNATAFVRQLHTLYQDFGIELTAGLLRRHRDITIARRYSNIGRFELNLINSRDYPSRPDAGDQASFVPPSMPWTQRDHEALSELVIGFDELNVRETFAAHDRRISSLEHEMRLQRIYQNGTSYNLMMRRREEARNDTRLRRLEKDIQDMTTQRNQLPQVPPNHELVQQQAVAGAVTLGLGFLFIFICAVWIGYNNRQIARM